MREKEINALCSLKLKRIHYLDSSAWKAGGSDTDHSHPHREIFVCLKGKYQFSLAGKMCVLSPGDVVLCESGVPHVFHAYQEALTMPTRAHMWIYMLDDKLMARVLAKYGMVTDANGNQRANFEDLSYSFFASEELCRQMSAHWNMGPEFMRGPVMCLMEEVRYYAKSGVIPKRLKQKDVVQVIKEYVRSNHGARCSLETLARLTNYSRYYLTHIFRKNAGCTIGSYIDQVRLSRSEQLFSMGKSQKEVAEDLGFSSPSAFWKWYRYGHPSY